MAAREVRAVSVVRMMFNFYHNIAFSNFIASLDIYCLHLKKRRKQKLFKVKKARDVYYTIRKDWFSLDHNITSACAYVKFAIVRHLVLLYRGGMDQG